RRVLGVIRPTTEMIGEVSVSGAVGILATTGTVLSNSYAIEVAKFFPETKIYQQACPMWVPLVENNEIDNPGTEYFVSKSIGALLQKSADIDTLLLACTHYPLLLKTIEKYAGKDIEVVTQGEIVANSLRSYLNRHPEIASRCNTNGQTRFLTTDSTAKFDDASEIFLGERISSEKITLQ
ncbi:MAG: glutamate racemase, partial [Cyclobacteriaceae bacterium]